MKHKKKKILCFSVAGFILCVSATYAYGKKFASAKTPSKQINAKQSKNIRKVENIQTQETNSKIVSETTKIQSASQYPLHKNISTTFFWAGEEAGKDNKNISNLPSAWDDDWVTHFGGVDDPKKRNGYQVAKFVPKENSFYFALPYNDFDEKGNRKKDVGNIIPWANSKKWASTESMCKNQWIMITKNGKSAYAQWQDVGPFGEDDSAYVFGGKAPKSKTNKDAGLDVSPAVKDYLGLDDIDKTDWQFVSAEQVPDGPWKKIVTQNQIYWN